MGPSCLLNGAESGLVCMLEVCFPFFESGNRRAVEADTATAVGLALSAEDCSGNTVIGSVVTGNMLLKACPCPRRALHMGPLWELGLSGS